MHLKKKTVKTKKLQCRLYYINDNLLPYDVSGFENKLILPYFLMKINGQKTYDKSTIKIAIV